MLKRCAVLHLRQVQLACSPDADVYMLVREPETCRYVVTLYHPTVCAVEGYHHREAVNEKELKSIIKSFVEKSAAGGPREEL